MSTAPKTLSSVEEYLRNEEIAEFRSEYHDGEVFPMWGATPNHVFITQNLVVALRQSLRRTECKIYSSAMRVSMPSGLYTYPDVLVACDEQQLGPGSTLQNPVLIAEVLSRSTRNYDRGDKFASYRSLASLREYLTVEQERIAVEHWVKKSSQWVLDEYRNSSDVIRLEIGIELPLADIYEGIVFETERS